MGNSLVSVIVPVYNVEKHLKSCVESVLCQTHTEVELILVDDGSPDKCGEICDQYAHTDPRVRVIHQKNSGLSAARNAGLDVATGTYIVFLDSDDMIHPQLLRLCVDTFKKSNADMVAYKYQEVSEEDRIYTKDLPSNIIFKTASANQVKQYFYDFFPDILSISAWARVYKKEIFANNRFNVGIIYEDMQILPSVLCACDEICYTNAPLYYYRQTANSIIRSNFSIKQFDMLYVEKNSLIPFIEENASKDSINKVYDSYIDNYIYLHFMKYENQIKEKTLNISYAFLYKKLVLVRWKNRLCSGGRLAILSLLSLVSIKWAFLFARKHCSIMFPYLQERLQHHNLDRTKNGELP